MRDVRPPFGYFGFRVIDLDLCDIGTSLAGRPRLVIDVGANRGGLRSTMTRAQIDGPRYRGIRVTVRLSL
jgi:hypothetical protein